MISLKKPKKKKREEKGTHTPGQEALKRDRLKSESKGKGLFLRLNVYR